MNAHGLLGHIVTKYTSQSENLATESLYYILNGSTAANKALVRYINHHIGIKLSVNISFRSQKRDENLVTPDLVGFDDQGNKVLIIESKFWAGLTENQPVNYINSLPNSTNTAMLVLAPSKRFTTLWEELVKRLNESGIKIDEINKDSLDWRVAKRNEYQKMALVSWRSVLSYIHSDLVTKGETNTASDMMQLIGLCDRMDSDALLPIHSEELSSSIGTRITQYCQIVDDVASTLVKEKLASKRGLRTGSGLGYYGRYMRIHGFGVLMQFNSEYWGSLRETPLWLSIQEIKKDLKSEDSEKWVYPYSAKDILTKFTSKEPSKLLDGEDKLLVPLYLPTGVEKKEIIASLIEQIKKVAECLQKAEPNIQSQV